MTSIRWLSTSLRRSREGFTCLEANGLTSSVWFDELCLEPNGEAGFVAPALPTVEFADSAKEQFTGELKRLNSDLVEAFNDGDGGAADANLYGLWILVSASNDIEKKRRTSLFRPVTNNELISAGLAGEVGATYYFYETFGYCFTIIVRKDVWHVLDFLGLQERTTDGSRGKIFTPLDSLKAFARRILNPPGDSA